jgi:hypothetical protein
VTAIDPGRIRVEPVRREWADALSHGDAEFTKRFGVSVEADWAGFPEALPIIIAAQGDEPDQWGSHLFFARIRQAVSWTRAASMALRC